MHRTLNGAVIVGLIALSVAGALKRLAPGGAYDPPAVALTLVALVALGVLAIHALTQDRHNARALVAGWAIAAISHLLVADWAAGFLRPGIAVRLLVTGLVAALYGVVVLSVPPHPARSDTHAVSRV